MDLKRKASFIKLNCEKILESMTIIESAKNENGIQTLENYTVKINYTKIKFFA